MREAILNELQTLLEASATIKFVFRQFKALDQLSSSQFPCVFIEEDLPEVGFDWKTSGFADVQFRVSLIMAVMSRDAVSTELTNLDVEVKKIVAANPTLNGKCLHITLEPESDRLGTLYAPYGLSVRPVQITYEGVAANGY